MNHEDRLRKFYPYLAEEIDRLKALKVPYSFYDEAYPERTDNEEGEVE